MNLVEGDGTQPPNLLKFKGLTWTKTQRCTQQSTKMIRVACAQGIGKNTKRFSNRRKENCIVQIDMESNRDTSSIQESED